MGGRSGVVTVASVGRGIADFALWSLAIEVAIAAVACGAAWLLPGPASERLGLLPGRIPARQVALLVLATLALSHALDALLEATGLRAHSALADIGALLSGLRSRDLALALLALVVAPGIAEELLCRGLVQRALAGRVGSGIAVGSSSLLFASLHGEPVHAGFALVLGLHLGAVAWWTGSTRAAIACHVANNLAALLLAALDPPGDPAPWWTGLVAAACAAAVWVRISQAGSAPPG